MGSDKMSSFDDSDEDKSERSEDDMTVDIEGDYVGYESPNFLKEKREITSTSYEKGYGSALSASKNASSSSLHASLGVFPFLRLIAN